MTTTDDLPNITERYSSAVRSSNLKGEERTTYSATDVLGAVALASVSNHHSHRDGHPLAMALLRWMVGSKPAVPVIQDRITGDGSAAEVIRMLAAMVCNRADHCNTKPRLRHLQAVDISRAVLAWHRDGKCKVCGGHGFKKIEGAPALSEHACGACEFGKLPFDREFSADQLGLARWLLAELERELSKAGPAAMATLAPSMELR